MKSSSSGSTTSIQDDSSQGDIDIEIRSGTNQTDPPQETAPASSPKSATPHASSKQHSFPKRGIKIMVFVALLTGSATGLSFDFTKETENEDDYVVDFSCQLDTDCQEKNVGNCCGYYPKCVNAEFEPDPSKSCPKGVLGVCGYPVIEYCKCSEEGMCVGVQGSAIVSKPWGA